jgi:hypothetical protein
LAHTASPNALGEQANGFVSHRRGWGERIIKTKESIITKVKTLVDRPPKEHVNYVHKRLPLLTPPPQKKKKIRIPWPRPLRDLDP